MAKNTKKPPSPEELIAFLNEQTKRLSKREIARAFDLKGDSKAYLKHVLKEIEIISTDSYGNPTSNTVLICRLYNITDALLTARVGDTVKIKYEREGVENTASIVLTEECINEIK